MVHLDSVVAFHIILMAVTVSSSRSLTNQSHQKSRPPEVMYISSNANLPEPGYLSLCCIVRGFPGPTVTWRSEDGITLTQKNWTLKNDSLVLSIAEIKSSAVNWTSRTNEGEVTCIASNALGTVKAVLNVPPQVECSRESGIRSQPVSNNTCEHLIRVVYGTGVISLAVGAIFTVIFMKLMDIYAKRKGNAERLPLNGFGRK